MPPRRPYTHLLLLLLLPASPSEPEPPAPSVAGDGTAGPGPAASPSAEPPPGPSSPPGPTAAGPSSPPGPTAAGPSSPAATRSPAEPELPEAAPRAGPWPEPVRDVAKLCACDLLVDQCDANCCCDPTCTAADFSLFTMCSVPVVTGDSQLCRQKEALYSIDPAAHPPQMRFQLADKVNPNVFCIQTANYKSALSFQSPEIPTSHNFDRLVQEFGGTAFGTETDLTSTLEAETQPALDANEISRYQYRDPIETLDGFLKLPAPLFGSQCADNNPSGFLISQAVKCSRMITPEECTTVEALGVQFYIGSSILAVPKSSQTVNITIQSITVQMPGGLRTRLQSTGAPLPPTLQNQSCSNAVLGASYLITFTEAGKITNAAVSLVLGTVNTRVFMQQSFAVRFVQQGTASVPLSGNPGYVIGLPIKAGFCSTGSGVVQSMNENGQLTMMKSSPAQDCLAVDGVRTPVLFGNNMMSGCQLRITQDANCELLAPALLNVLKGQNFPDCVAPFGNSLPQNDSSWVQIYNNVTKLSTCEIPVSFEMEVKWTKYGSLVNPQAKIVSLTATVLTAALPQVDPASERTLQILTSVTFVDVSAPAEPGYRARPTIEAKLPFDFFFPFV
ncbi:tectonic-1 [Tiliqua scincoides]|uniref:tectonic-1 n=1 Tax=Tiliqua scincoides TaxID=71010 RepID=UPI003461AD95